MRLDLRRVAETMRRATTEDLLDRVTVYRDEMEPAAVDLIEGELSRRGHGPDEVAEHDRHRRETVLYHPDGRPVRCNFCSRPAVARGRGWHKLLGRLPLFPRLFAGCEVHADRVT
jgi:hypothetical protein